MATGGGNLRAGSQDGFTFIELVVVMIIMGLALSIVAPGLFDYFAKMEIRDELKRVNAILRTVSTATCVSQVPRSVKLSGGEMLIMPDGRVYSFKKIAFPEEIELLYNRRGFCSKDSVRVRAGQRLWDVVTDNRGLDESRD